MFKETKIVKVSKKDVKSFIDFCVIAYSSYSHSKILFEYGELRKTLLWQTAPIFFGDLNRIFIEYNILQVCKLTDAKEINIKGGKRENLVVDFFLQDIEIHKNKEKTKALRSLSKKMHKFREKLVLARHRRISHFDRELALRKRSVGAASNKEWKKFWNNLGQFLCLLHEHYFKEPFHLTRVGNISDADSLIGALKKSTYFETLFSYKELKKTCSEVLLESEYFNEKITKAI